MQSALIKILPTEELKAQYLSLSRQVTEMQSVSCPIGYLKELCDKMKYNVSYRLKGEYNWCFFRLSETSPIIFVARSEWSNIDSKMIVSRNIIRRLLEFDVPVHKEYDESKYDDSLILLVGLYAREVAKRSPLHPSVAVANIAMKKRMTVRWRFEKSVEGWTCYCVANHKFGRGKTLRVSASAPVKEGSKDECKRLASVNMLKLMSSI